MADMTNLTPQPMQYAPQTMRRAMVAFMGTPFRWALLEAMRDRSISITQITGAQGVEANYTDKPLSETAAENQMIWLIQVGLLRREVDGQGLTDSFRLTPLGRQILREWQGKTPTIAWGDRLSNKFRFWFSRFAL